MFPSVLLEEVFHMTFHSDISVESFPLPTGFQRPETSAFADGGAVMRCLFDESTP